MLNRPKNQKYFCGIVAIPNVLRAPSLRSYFMQNGHFVVLNTSADDYSHSLRKKVDKNWRIWSQLLFMVHWYNTFFTMVVGCFMAEFSHLVFTITPWFPFYKCFLFVHSTLLSTKSGRVSQSFLFNFLDNPQIF